MIQIFSKADIKYKKQYYTIRKKDGYISITNKKRIMKWTSYRLTYDDGTFLKGYAGFFDLYDIYEIESEEEKTKLKCMKELIS